MIMDHLDAAEEAHLRNLTAAEAEGDERAVEAALRPRTLDEVVGQQRVRAQLGWCSRRHASASDRPTTCCSRVHPASARPRSP